MLFTPKEPRVARFTEDGAMVKDHHFYKNRRDIGWNLPARIREKHYPHFHMQKDNHKLAIEEMHLQERRDKAIQEQLRKEYILEKKSQTKETFAKIQKDNRIIERASAQVFNKPNLLEFDFFDNNHKDALDLVARRVNTSKHLRSNENKWNFLNVADKKFVEQSIRPICIKGEEETIKHAQKKADEELQAYLERKKKLQEFHDERRRQIIQKHENNIDFEERCGLVSPHTMSIMPTTSTSRATYRGTTFRGNALEPVSPRSQSNMGPLSNVKSFNSGSDMVSELPPNENSSFKLKFGKFLKATTVSRVGSSYKLAEPKEVSTR
jgi:hypothetical protein